jgi:hypothetical protein
MAKPLPKLPKEFMPNFARSTTGAKSRDNLIRQLVELANANNDDFVMDYQWVKKNIDANDLVVAVWQDPSEPLGVGTLIIKGRRLLREVIATNTATPGVKGQGTLARRSDEIRGAQRPGHMKSQLGAPVVSAVLTPHDRTAWLGM